jgi:hypothetical protein
MADMAIRLAKEPRPPLDLRRGEFLLGRRETADVRGDVEATREVVVEPATDVPAASPAASAEARV